MGRKPTALAPTVLQGLDPLHPLHGPLANLVLDTPAARFLANGTACLDHPFRFVGVGTDGVAMDVLLCFSPSTLSITINVSLTMP